MRILIGRHVCVCFSNQSCCLNCTKFGQYTNHIKIHSFLSCVINISPQIKCPQILVPTPTISTPSNEVYSSKRWPHSHSHTLTHTHSHTSHTLTPPTRSRTHSHTHSHTDSLCACVEGGVDVWEFENAGVRVSIRLWMHARVSVVCECVGARVQGVYIYVYVWLVWVHGVCYG